MRISQCRTITKGADRQDGGEPEERVLHGYPVWLVMNCRRFNHNRQLANIKLVSAAA